MSQLRFDGRTVIITGAGGNPSLGRAHALLLAARGAKVVVNDIGRDPEGGGYYRDAASADAVVAEIRAAGGTAVADTHSVATPKGAAAIVQTALDAFGRVDILINNAVIGVVAPFDEQSPRDFERQVAVNLLGPIWMSRAVWPHMKAAGYGRIVNIASGAFVGANMLSAYGITKGGVFSLTRVLATEGIELGIKVNTVNPGGFTRGAMASLKPESAIYKRMKETMAPELVSPVVAYLAHEACPVTGECLEAVGGMVRRFYVAATSGFIDRALTMETLAAHWDEVMAGAATGFIGVGATPAESYRRTKP